MDLFPIVVDLFQRWLKLYTTFFIGENYRRYCNNFSLLKANAMILDLLF